ncbi:CotD family spore coat protein [Lysinibacillus sp. LZ02]|uniref:CotD family spore coat protein n=1 Tax=Lysinibacillus sp. LZ02 TaxID=3420668 RepID=UPI003D363C61
MYFRNWFNPNEAAGAFNQPGFNQQPFNQPGFNQPGFNQPMFNQPGGNQSPVRFPPQTFPTQYEQPVVSPTQEFIRTNIFNTVVPHVHPSHTTTVNRHMVNNQHFFPHTESVVHECFETNTMCGMPPNHCHKPRRRR